MAPVQIRDELKSNPGAIALITVYSVVGALIILLIVLGCRSCIHKKRNWKKLQDDGIPLVDRDAEVNTPPQGLEDGIDMDYPRVAVVIGGAGSGKLAHQGSGDDLSRYPVEEEWPGNSRSGNL